MSLRDDILAEFKPAIERVEIKGHSMPVYVKSLDAAGVMAILDAETDTERAMQCVLMSVCEEDGTRVFSDEDMDTLRTLSWPFIDGVSTSVLRLNGLDGEEEGGGLAGKSEPPPGGDSPSV